MAAGTFTPATFSFLRELRENNDRDWFAANKQRYERDVRDASLRFIAGFGPRLATFAPRLVADARPSGGSMFRIYRDTRFSHDKSPYKIHVGIHFFNDQRPMINEPCKPSSSSTSAPSTPSSSPGGCANSASTRWSIPSTTPSRRFASSRRRR